MSESSISIVTCVSDFAQYEANVVGSVPAAAAELLPIDNVGNPYSAPEALNLGWSRAHSDLIVFCHQDVIFPSGWLDQLRAQIAQVEELSKGHWGVAGTFGRRGRGYHGHIDDPFGNRLEGMPLPAAVETLDENCLVVSRDLPLRFDVLLNGFHLYGVDICLSALAQGRWNWALDCCLKHLSAGRKDDSYYALRRVLERKWRWERWRRRATRRIPAKVYGPNGPLHFGLRHAITR